MSTLLEACEKIAPRIRQAAPAGDEARQVSAEIVAELARTSAFKMLVPRAYGGLETNPSEMVAVIESVARADSALGWCLMVGATSGLLSAYLAPDAGRELFGASDVIACGVFAPTGEATELPSGEFRIRGRWAFASGCAHSRYRTLGVVVMRDGKPALTPEGEMDLRHFVLDANDTKIVETWDTSGLRGSGSHDLVVENAVVPASRAIRFIGAAPTAKGALYTFPPIGLLSLGVAAVCLGIAREAISELVQLAQVKKSVGARRSIAERELVQVAVGEGRGSRLFRARVRADHRRRSARQGITRWRDRRPGPRASSPRSDPRDTLFGPRRRLDV